MDLSPRGPWCQVDTSPRHGAFTTGSSIFEFVNLQSIKHGQNLTEQLWFPTEHFCKCMSNVIWCLPVCGTDPRVNAALSIYGRYQWIVTYLLTLDISGTDWANMVCSNIAHHIQHEILHQKLCSTFFFSGFRKNAWFFFGKSLFSTQFLQQTYFWYNENFVQHEILRQIGYSNSIFDQYWKFRFFQCFVSRKIVPPPHLFFLKHFFTKDVLQKCFFCNSTHYSSGG